jgi:hypothetical protein
VYEPLFLPAELSKLQNVSTERSYRLIPIFVRSNNPNGLLTHQYDSIQSNSFENNLNFFDQKKKVFTYARKVEKKEWVEIWKIISGLQTDEHWKDYIKTDDYTKLNTEEKFEAQWKWADGSDMRTWWD